MINTDVSVLPNAEFSNVEVANPDYVKSIEVQGTNLYKLHVAGEVETADLFQLPSDSKPHTAHSLVRSRPTTSFTDDNDAGMHSRLDDNDTLKTVDALSNKSKAIVFSAFGKLAPKMNEKLAGEGSFNTHHGRSRRGGVSGRSTNTILNRDGTFITNVDTQFQMEVEVAKSVMVVDKRNVQEKVKAAVGELVFPPGLRAKTPGKHKSDTELDKRLVGMPGGLHLSKVETSKYFGPDSRVKFFERGNFIRNQRIIASTDATHESKKLLFDSETAGGNVNSDHNVKNQLDCDVNGDTQINRLAAEIPFYPVRVDNTVKVNTKIIIRTQSLDVTSSEFQQLKLIPKPVHCSDIEPDEPPTPVATAAVATAKPVSPKKQASFDPTQLLPHQKHPSEQYSSSIKNIDETMRSINFEMTTNTITRLLNIGPPPTPNLVIKKPFSLLDPITPRDATPSSGNNSKPGSVAVTPSAATAGSAKGGQRRASQAVKTSGNSSSSVNGGNVNSNSSTSGGSTGGKTTTTEVSAGTSIGTATGATTGAATPSTSTAKAGGGKGRKAMVQLTPLKPKSGGSSSSTGGGGNSSGNAKSSTGDKPNSSSSGSGIGGSDGSSGKSEGTSPSPTEGVRSADVTTSDGKKPDSAASSTKPTTASSTAAPSEQQQHQQQQLHSLHLQHPHRDSTFGGFSEFHHSIHQQQQGPLEFIVIDHRDNLNKPLKKRSHTNSGQENTLYKYVTQKEARHYDFNNAVDQEMDSDEEKTTPEDLAQVPVAPDDVPLSPRSHYIDSCIRKRLNPRASLILRKKFTKQLSLQHHGIGDEMMCLFADAIINIPYIESLNLSDNNLTDKSLGPIVLAVVKMKELVDLNISFNTIGPVAASSLAHYLADPDCPLERLVLRRADIDDGECERFVTALKTNTHLKELDLSENLIGISENLNSVMPDIVTGGEALADLLRSGGCVLTSLKLGWNMLRLDGAADFCNSLKTNSTLTFLDLSFNSLGSVGGIALGDALQDNKTLKTLFISNNSIDSMACLTICAGILENEALTFVAFDGNPIGEVGARALMLLPTMVGSRVKLSAAACNIGIKDPRCWFDSTQLLRKFELKLDEHFDRAVALFLMCLIAAHQTYFIAHSEWYDDETKTTVNLGLAEHVVVNFENSRLDAEQLSIIESLRVVKSAASNITKALELFRDIDEDGSGQLDKEEFAHLMECMGMEMGKGKVEEVMAEYDCDGGGFIELPEFLLFLKNQLKEATVRLKELSEFPVMAIFNGVEPQDRVRYVPPRHGILKIVVQDGFTQKPTYRVINGSDKDYIIDIARQSGDLLKMAQFGVQSYKIRFPEAMSLTESLLKENNNKPQVLGKVLPQIAKAADARMLVSKVLMGNKTDIQRLKREIGLAIKPMLGCSDGYYILDLSNPMDKICLNKLLEQSMTVAFIRGKTRNKLGFGALGDCSQQGNWSCFRNELFNGKPIILTTDFASPMPRTGKLEFDFVSERRVEKDNFVLSDVKVTNMLAKFNLLLPVEREEALTRLLKVKKASDLTLNGDARTVYECPLDKAQEISYHMAMFYDNLTQRSVQVEKFRQKESIKVKMEHDYNTVTVNATNIRRYYRIPSMNVPKMYTAPNLTKKPATGRMSAVVPPVTPGGSSAAAAATATTPGGGGAGSRGNTTAGSGQQQQPKTPNSSRPITAPKTARNAVVATPKTAAATLAPINTESWSDEETLESSEANADEKDDLSSLDVHDVNNELSSDEEEEQQQQQEEHHHHRHTSQTKKNPNEVSEEAKDNGLNFPRKPITLKTLTSMEMVMTKLQVATELDEFMNRYVCTMGSSNVPVQAKAARQLELFIDIFEYQFFYSRHLELMLDLFREVGSAKTSEYFGTYRVELVVALFACIVDVHNFEIVLRSLTAFEVACVYCRLGWLHLYNPMKPEGAYELDLSRREERQIVKTLTQLATVEPGDNLPTLAFRWERDMATMPGYELTEPWLTEEGLPRKGLWTAVYYSGEGTCKKGCKPFVKLRRSMLQMVFIDEADVVLESDRDSETPPQLFGEAFMMANLGMWYGYLAYNEEEYKAIKAKKASDAAAAAKLAKKRK